MTTKSGSGSSSKGSSPNQHLDRRTRREAQRQARRGAPPPSKRKSPSPLTLITGGAILVGLLVVGFLVLQNRAPTTIAEPSASTPAELASGRTLGDANAPVKLDVWSDFQCPACLQFWTKIEPQVVSTYVATGKVQLIYHDFTFLGPESLDAAVAARCADQQGKFWPYHDLLFANQGAENSGAFSEDRLAQMATQVGLDMAAWTTCIADPAIAQAVKDETAAGQQAGVNGTPTVFVNGTALRSYDYATISTAIEAALATASPSVSASASP